MNININKDDHNINDYLYCWNLMNERPNKINLFSHYNTEKFQEFILEKSATNSGSFTDVVPTIDGDHIINEKVLLKINDGLYLSYTFYDKLSDTSLVGGVSIFYNNIETKLANKIVKSLGKIEDNSEEIEDTIEESKINTLVFTQNGLDIEPFNSINGDFENIKLYYNKNIFKKSKKLIKKINKSSKGLSIIHGERGTGKTTLANYILMNIEKKSIFIPCSLIETTINNPDFRTFLKRHKDTILVIDDSEIYFSEIYSKSNIFTNNLLQYVDGFQSDDLNINILVILNSEADDIDHTLIECNNLIDIIETDRLDVDTINTLNKHLKNKEKSNSPKKLVDVLKNRDFSLLDEEIGFK